MTIADLPTDERQVVHGLLSAPFVVLRIRVGRFEPPFEWLERVDDAFDPLTRFILDGVLAADEHAIAARDARIAYYKASVFMTDAPEAVHTLRRFMQETHLARIQTFVAERYHWLSQSSVDPLQARPDKLDAILDDIVAATLAEHGFDVRKRKRTKSEWRCSAVLAGEPAVLYFDKGSWRLSAHLDVPSCLAHYGLGDPFFGSLIEFPWVESALLEEHVRRFFTAYGRILPHVTLALGEAKRIRDTYLRQGLAEAEELARALLDR